MGLVTTTVPAAKNASLRCTEQLGGLGLTSTIIPSVRPFFGRVWPVYLRFLCTAPSINFREIADVSHCFACSSVVGGAPRFLCSLERGGTLLCVPFPKQLAAESEGDMKRSGCCGNFCKISRRTRAHQSDRIAILRFYRRAGPQSGRSRIANCRTTATGPPTGSIHPEVQF